MSDFVEDAAFWLPSDFFDDFLMEGLRAEMKMTPATATATANTATESDSAEFRFPTEFPYELGTESDSLKKKWAEVVAAVVAAAPTSPQSTLVNNSAGGSSNGSPDGVASPPLRRGNNDGAVGDLINQAAGQVAKLKLTAGVGPGPVARNNPVGPPKPGPPAHFHGNRPKGPPQKPRSRPVRAVWPVYPGPARHYGQGPRPFPLGRGRGRGGPAPPPPPAAAAANWRAGTGVFLPRRYVISNDNVENNKTGYNVPCKRDPILVPDNNNGIGFGPKTAPNPISRPNSDMVVVRKNAEMWKQEEGGELSKKI
ncbi:formin-like protein 16 [Andrographis paniculata]|uniref:formin-like protein 16 n=1 Tax=Andrographis paniculata TaxID=175694 RepID=UPI0021E7F4E6|nr:formin-like protein 16 [Andrographis paniculata]